MRSLLWKEWHEQRWKLAFGSLILAAFALIGLRARVLTDTLMLESVCVLATLLLPVLASTGLLPAERSDGTLPMLFALPVNARRIFQIKTVMGVLLCLVPLLIAALVSVAIAGGREIDSGAIILLYIRTLAATLSLFFWMFTLTVRLPTETRAALIALGVLVSWLIVHLALLQSWNSDYIHKDPPSAFWTIDPFRFFIGFTDGNWIGSAGFDAVIQGLILLVLWKLADWQLAREAEGRS